MSAIPTAIIDTLNGLLEAEVNSIFRFVREGAPYLSTDDAGLRALMNEMDTVCTGHRHDLVKLIESLGGVPRVRRHAIDEEQYLAFLSLKFLLPKLVNEKDLLLTRFENAQATIDPDYPQVRDLLLRIESEQRRLIEQLKGAAAKVTGGKFTAPTRGTTGQVPAE